MKKVLFLLLYTHVIGAQTVIKSADLLADFEIARQSYEQMHPGLYKYQSKEKIDAAFERCKKSLAKDQTLTEAYLRFHQLTSSFKCGHAYPNFFNQEATTKKEIFEGTNTLPFHFKLFGDRMLVVRSCDQKVKVGVEIIKINGNKIPDIIKTILPIVRADGSNDGKRRSLLENGKEYFNYFDIFYPLFFPLKKSKFELELHDLSTTTKTTVVVDAVNHAERDKSIKLAYPDAQIPKWNFDWLDYETAIMTINNFNNYDGKSDYDSFFAAAQAEYQNKGGKNLIIDIRKNEGGNSSEMVKLIPYFLDKPIEYYELQNTWQMLKISPDLKPYVKNGDWAASWFDQSVSGFTPTDAGQWKSKNLDQPQVFTPHQHQFLGNVYLLSGPTNSSAAYMMVDIFKKYNLATVVGQTTGGNQKGVTAGAMFFILLPHSNIEIDVPLIGTDLAIAQSLPDAGVLPHIFIEPNISDACIGVDTEIEAVKKIIYQKKQ